MKTQPFRERISKYTAKEIVDKIGCSLPTAYDWRSGRRAPPAWTQDQYIKIMEENPTITI